MGSQPSIADSLESLIAVMVGADPSDRDVIIQVGTGLEKVLCRVRDGSRARGLLVSALEVLQASYQGACEAGVAMSAAAEAAAAARALVAGDAAEGDASVREAGDVLAAILSGDRNRRAEEALHVAPEGPPDQTERGTEAGGPADRDARDPDQADAPAAGDLPEGPAVLSQDADLELLGEFVTECMDHITAAEGALLGLETNPNDPEPINTVFRAFHTIKGTSGFLGLEHILRLAHKAENLLDRARDGEVRIVGGYADLALRSCDTLKTMIEDLRGAKPGDELEVPGHLADLLATLADPESAGVSEDEDGGDPLRVGDILVARRQATRKDVEQAAKAQGDRKLGAALVEEGAASAAEVAQALRTQKKLAGATAEATVRVATDRLDSLMNMVGELVIAHSMIAQDPEVVGERLTRNVAHSGKIIREMQDLAMSLRMVPLKGTFQKMARLVRDLSRKAGKSVQFVTEGEDTEIDRNMVDMLNDPLIHMVRNAVDHGLEPPEQRAAAGKGPTGRVSLRAYHSAGNVVIELGDDGRGLNRERILAKAVERGLISSGKEMSDGEAFSLIFQPGFSTAEKVTDISGRGVGMDVVKRNIEALRGRVDISSRPGQGSTFAVRLPLTMAITDGMLLRVGEQRYLLPTISIEQSFVPERGALTTVVGRGEAVMLRGRLMPLFRLQTLFHVPDAQTDPCRALLIAIEAEGRRCALMADELLGQQQVVIKSLGRMLGEVPGVAGGAILGDGRVGLILDAAGIMKLAHSGAPAATGACSAA